MIFVENSVYVPGPWMFILCSRENHIYLSLWRETSFLFIWFFVSKNAQDLITPPTSFPPTPCSSLSTSCSNLISTLTIVSSCSNSSCCFSFLLVFVPYKLIISALNVSLIMRYLSWLWGINDVPGSHP